MTEVSVLVSLQSLIGHSTGLQWLAVVLARGLIFLPVVIVCTGFRMRRDRAATWHLLMELLWAVGIAIILVSLLAWMVDRPRPYLNYQEIYRLIPAPWTTSFPSGHSATAAAMALILARRSWKWGVFGCICALGVGLGRLLVGVHYPTDVLMGFVLGAIAAGIVSWGHRQLRMPDVTRMWK